MNRAKTLLVQRLFYHYYKMEGENSYMTLKAIVAFIGKTKCVPLRDAHNVVERLLSRLNRPHPDENNNDVDLDEYMDRDTSHGFAGILVDFTKLIVSADSFDGNADDFHNLAVVYAKANSFSYACDILERGLEQFVDAVDLLADYLIYGIKCNRFDKCRLYYETLNNIPKQRWNWRAFDFSIDYLLVRLSRGAADVDEKSLEELSNAFIRLCPTEDRAYLSKATVYQALGKNRQSIKVLETATGKNSRAKRTPMCALRLAKHYFEEGEYEKALYLIAKAKNDNIEDQPSINRASLFIISCLCKYAKFSIGYDSQEELSEEMAVLIDSAYQDFAISKKHNLDNMPDVLPAYMDELQLITGINNPYV